MPEHRFHRTIGALFNGLVLSADKKIWLDPACDPDSTGVVTLFHGPGSDEVRFCLVDILITLPNMVVIVEIEESDVKPLHLFGKFYASAFSTHFNGQDISKLPLFFIQVLDTSEINLKEGQKSKQWDRIEQILRGQAANWPERTVSYKLFRGSQGDFEIGGEEAGRMLDFVKRCLET